MFPTQFSPIKIRKQHHYLIFFTNKTDPPVHDDVKKGQAQSRGRSVTGVPSTTYLQDKREKGMRCALLGFLLPAKGISGYHSD